MLAAGFSVALTFSAGAQSSPWQIAPAVQNTAKDSAAKDTPADDAEAAAGEAPPAADANDADILKDIDQSKLDWSQLDTDSTSLPTLAPKGAAKRGSVAGNDPSWTTNNNANGSSAVSVKQSISPFLDTRIGADMTVAKPATTTAAEAFTEVDQAYAVPAPWPPAAGRSTPTLINLLSTSPAKAHMPRIRSRVSTAL